MSNLRPFPTREPEQAPASAPGSWCDAWFDRDPLPRFVLGEQARLIYANRAARNLIDAEVVTVTNGALRFGSTDSNNTLQKAFLQIMRTDESDCRMIVRDRTGEWRAADLYRAEEGGLAFLTLHAASQCVENNFAVVKSTFGLSHAEGQVLGRLLAGDCPKEAARSLSLSEHTIRSQLRAIYAKLGVKGLSGVYRFTLQLVA